MYRSQEKPVNLWKDSNSILNMSGQNCLLRKTKTFPIFMHFFLTNIVKQECIPVGCIPPAAVAVCWGGVHAGIPPASPWMWA